MREALAGFPPSVPLADLMHHRCVRILGLASFLYANSIFCRDLSCANIC